ncbi:MAG: hypothetical protein GY798_17345 [Hyphomicrobiales bacterium]|nr:hypothetical protein [Hyphomicrobiales bacterium]
MDAIAGIDLRAFAATDRTTWRHVVVTSDDGLIGVGEYTGDRVVRRLEPVAERARDLLVGEEIQAQHGPELAVGLGGTFEAWAVGSAVDQALEDLRAQHHGVPLAASLNPGASDTPIRLYANINRRIRDRSPASFAASAADALTVGFGAIKIAPFDGLTPDLCGTTEGDSLIAAGFERIAATGDVLAGGAELMVDCHWRFSAEQAHALLPEFAASKVTWLECPIPETVDAIPQLCAIRSRCAEAGLRLAGCELMTGVRSFEPYLTAGAYDVVMPDVKYAGGLLETIRIAEAAERAGVGCSLHNPSGPIAHQHSVHVAAAIGSAERLEYQFDESPLFFRMTEPAPAIVEGEARLSDRPGLGIGLTNKGASA